VHTTLNTQQFQQLDPARIVCTAKTCQTITHSYLHTITQLNKTTLHTLTIQGTWSSLAKITNMLLVMSSTHVIQMIEWLAEDTEGNTVVRLITLLQMFQAIMLELMEIETHLRSLQ
jgi:hypothetical protein